MPSLTLAQLLSVFSPDAVLYGLDLPAAGTVYVYTVQDGVIYHHCATATGHGFKVPQTISRAAWVRMARACAFTAPVNPDTMPLGRAGERLGAYWQALDLAAEGRAGVTDLCAAAEGRPGAAFALAQ